MNHRLLSHRLAGIFVRLKSVTWNLYISNRPADTKFLKITERKLLKILTIVERLDEKALVEMTADNIHDQR